MPAGNLLEDFTQERMKVLALAHMLQLHSTILSSWTEMSIASRGFLSLTATVTTPQWQLPWSFRRQHMDKVWVVAWPQSHG